MNDKKWIKLDIKNLIRTHEVQYIEIGGLQVVLDLRLF